MYFAIVDDEETILHQIPPLIKRFSHNDDIQCDCFLDAEQFLSAYHAMKYDALFLDIDMPVINGFDLTEQLRSRGDSIPIVYITGRDDLVTHAFRYKALGFVHKQILEKELSFALSTVLSELQRTEPTITVKTILSEGGHTESVRIADITCIETFNHNILIHLVNGHKLTTRNQLSTYIEGAGFEHYAQISTGVLVNLAHVTLKADKVILQDGSDRFISRRRIKAVRDAYLKFRKKVLI